ncbi:MAG TPA: hypothetical protein VGD37_03915 [Kofleriaceae bacterium]|jgi:hypothetical protein
MKLVTWRNTALALAVICGCQRWQSCSHTAAPAEPATPELRPARETPATPRAAPSAAASPGEPASTPGKTFHGFQIPAWAMRLAPQRGETLRAYRDRILPVAELAVAPQRARVARLRDDFAQLDPKQRAELDAAVADAARAIEDRVRTALAGGELAPATFKPMTGIAVARDVLAIVDRGNTRFLGSLTPDQRTRLASHRFDFADYLVFSARWEDALHALD